MMRKQIDAKLPLLERGVQRCILLLNHFNAGAEDGNGCLSSFQAFLSVLALVEIVLLLLFCRPFPFLFASYCL